MRHDDIIDIDFKDFIKYCYDTTLLLSCALLMRQRCHWYLNFFFFVIYDFFFHFRFHFFHAIDFISLVTAFSVTFFFIIIAIAFFSLRRSFFAAFLIIFDTDFALFFTRYFYFSTFFFFATLLSHYWLLWRCHYHYATWHYAISFFFIWLCATLSITTPLIHYYAIFTLLRHYWCHAIDVTHITLLLILIIDAMMMPRTLWCWKHCLLRMLIFIRFTITTMRRLLRRYAIYWCHTAMPCYAFMLLLRH